MNDVDIEGRLRSMLTGRADLIDTVGVPDTDVVEVRGLSDPLVSDVHRGAPRRSRAGAASVIGLSAAAAAVLALATGALTSRHSSVGSEAASPGGASGGLVTYVQVGRDFGVWIPADQSGQWELRVPGLSPQKADCAAFPYFHGPSTVSVSPSRSAVSTADVPNCDQGSWSMYRPAFAASLPSDPSALLASMRGTDLGDRDVDAFVTGSGFISQGWVRPRVVDNIVAALKLIAGVQVRQGVVNGAGARGEQISFTGQQKSGVSETWSVVVDDAGRVIGSGVSDSVGSSFEDLTYRTVTHLGDTH